MRLLKSEGVFSFILPSGWFGASQAGALRQFLTYKTRPIDVVILPWDVFDDCWVDTALLAGAKRTNEISDARSATDAIRICVFPKKHGTVTAREISQGGWRLSIADWTAAATGEWLVAASPEALVVLKKSRRRAKDSATSRTCREALLHSRLRLHHRAPQTLVPS